MSYWSFGFPVSLHIAKIVIYLWCSHAPALPINQDVGGVILGKTALNWCFGTLSVFQWFRTQLNWLKSIGNISTFGNTFTYNAG